MKLIDADKYFELLRDDLEITGDCFRRAIDHLNSIQTVDAVEVVHGHWIVDESGTHKCSECHDTIPDEQSWCGADYCPNCGAKMDGGT